MQWALQYMIRPPLYDTLSSVWYTFFHCVIYPPLCDNPPLCDTASSMPLLCWQPPEPPDRWPGVRDATSHGWVCPQLVFHPDTQRDVQREDCLYLDIYAPYQVSLLSQTYISTDLHDLSPILLTYFYFKWTIFSSSHHLGLVIFIVFVVTICDDLFILLFTTKYFLIQWIHNLFTA